ncbi:MAG TPA: CARDB domain-containing protein [Candidatus Thermoplasmatota archaeon]|nr:CARDB domain-containing protein [Candidatus Thermoplasmatota archaeon]
MRLVPPLLCLALVAATLPALAVSELPDLRVELLASEPASPWAGDATTFHARVTNAGTAPAGPFVVRFAMDGVALSQQAVAGLAPGESAILSGTWSARAGSHELAVMADADEAVAEADESNNAATLPLEVLALVTLRVAPEGFVVPNHWLVGNPAVWIVDPVADPSFNGLDGVAGCVLAVADATGDFRVDGGEVLDAAAASGCVSGWEFGSSSCCGRFVTSVDGLAEAGWPASWWLLQIDGFGSWVGIDDMDLLSGQSLELVHLVGP